MSSGAYIEDATDFARALTLGETARAGDHGNAMRRISRRIGVGVSVLKHLHYSAPKTIDTADFVRLGTAYGKHRLGNAEKQFTPRTALGRFLVRQADALDRFADALDRQEDGAVDG